MDKKQSKLVMETRHATSLQAAEQYTAPQIEVIDIELENVFAASPMSDDLPDMPGFDW